MDELRSTLFATLTRESPEAFLVTGRLEMTVTTRVANSKVLLPGWVDLDLGTTRATVRVPGTVPFSSLPFSLLVSPALPQQLLHQLAVRLGIGHPGRLFKGPFVRLQGLLIPTQLRKGVAAVVVAVGPLLRPPRLQGAAVVTGAIEGRTAPIGAPFEPIRRLGRSLRQAAQGALIGAQPERFPIKPRPITLLRVGGPCRRPRDETQRHRQSSRPQPHQRRRPHRRDGRRTGPTAPGVRSAGVLYPATPRPP